MGFHRRFKRYRNSGLSLVELLVVIAIVTVILGFMVPQLRTMTKERGIRAAATMLATALNEAAGQARVEGYAAIELVRNRNVFRTPRMQDNSLGDNIHYACYSVRRLSAPEPYFGNDTGDEAEVKALVNDPPLGSTDPDRIVIDIPTPLDTNLVLSAGCVIKLGDNPCRYQVTNVNGVPAPNPALPPLPPPALNHSRLVVTRAIYQPYPESGSRHSFRVDRPAAATNNLNSAIIDDSDVTDIVLPNGYFLNLNYSGPLVTRDTCDFTWTAFSEAFGAALNAESIVIEFGPSGGVAQIWTNGLTSGGPVLVPNSAIQFCLAADSERHTFDLSGTQQMPKSYYQFGSASAGPDLLNEPDVLWVTLNHLTGRVNIGENADVGQIAKPENAATIATDMPQRILQSLRIARKGKLAAQ